MNSRLEGKISIWEAYSDHENYHRPNLLRRSGGFKQSCMTKAAPS